jgi:hypothetical protein
MPPDFPDSGFSAAQPEFVHVHARRVCVVLAAHKVWVHHRPHKTTLLRTNGGGDKKRGANSNDGDTNLPYIHGKRRHTKNNYTNAGGNARSAQLLLHFLSLQAACDFSA